METGTAETAIEQLERRLGADWKSIRRARARTRERRQALNTAFERWIAPDTSVVLFGSVAREEMTSDSDADWILLIDGQAFPEHDNQKQEISAKLSALDFKDPGRSGVFGCMVSSHSLVHEIGGEDDTNSNTTRRVLLLLESYAVGNAEAFGRVRTQILNRYLKDDRGLLHSNGPLKVPRFLMNDLTRYWRTITVDFVYKQRSDGGQKWCLRNAKLRTSRKLVFASGLLRCFFCQLDPAAAEARDHLRKTHDVSQLLLYMTEQLKQTPLEILARAASRLSISTTTQKKLFDSYDCFLQVLDDESKRKHLSNLRPDQMNSSEVWSEIRKISKDFQEGLQALFFEEDEELKELTLEYGVF